MNDVAAGRLSIGSGLWARFGGDFFKVRDVVLHGENAPAIDLGLSGVGAVQVHFGVTLWRRVKA